MDMQPRQPLRLICHMITETILTVAFVMLTYVTVVMLLHEVLMLPALLLAASLLMRIRTHPTSPHALSPSPMRICHPMMLLMLFRLLSLMLMMI